MRDYPVVDNDGYYQELDENRFEDFEDGLIGALEDLKKSRFEVSYKDPKYDEIIHDSSTKRGRRKFVEERNRIHAERSANFKIDRERALDGGMLKSEVFCKCKNCGGGFVAKTADRKRGWAKFCSKSCKAQY